MLDAFLRELPWFMGIWVVATVALVVFGALTGDFSPRESLRIAVGVLPLAIPLAPLTWMRFEPRTREPRTREARSLPALGFGCLWALVTMPLAIGLSLFLTRLVGAD